VFTDPPYNVAIEYCDFSDVFTTSYGNSLQTVNCVVVDAASGVDRGQDEQRLQFA
jgi:adenine-specific DNA methylase